LLFGCDWTVCQQNGDVAAAALSLPHCKSPCSGTLYKKNNCYSHTTVADRNSSEDMLRRFLGDMEITAV
ncbi:hypothetical protein T4B_15608, partial [Trichinella pseudospiralis]